MKVLLALIFAICLANCQYSTVISSFNATSTEADQTADGWDLQIQTTITQCGTLVSFTDFFGEQFLQITKSLTPHDKLKISYSILCNSDATSEDPEVHLKLDGNVVQSHNFARGFASAQGFRECTEADLLNIQYQRFDSEFEVDHSSSSAHLRFEFPVQAGQASYCTLGDFVVQQNSASGGGDNNNNGGDDNNNNNGGDDNNNNNGDDDNNNNNGGDDNNNGGDDNNNNNGGDDNNNNGGDDNNNNGGDDNNNNGGDDNNNNNGGDDNNNNNGGDDNNNNGGDDNNNNNGGDDNNNNNGGDDNNNNNGGDDNNNNGGDDNNNNGGGDSIDGGDDNNNDGGDDNNNGGDNQGESGLENYLQLVSTILMILIFLLSQGQQQ